MKLTKLQKQQIIVGSIATIDQSIEVLRSGASALTAEDIEMLTDDLPELYQLAAQLRIAETEENRAEIEIISDLIEDVKVIHLAQMELNEIRETQEQREKLFELLKNLALGTALTVTKAMI